MADSMDIDFAELLADEPPAAVASSSGTTGAAAMAVDAHPETVRLLNELDRKAAARKMAVPTRDLDVRQSLREFGEPITLFGERPEDRRERLRGVMMRLREQAGEGAGAGAVESESGSEDGDSDEDDEEFFTEGTDLLKAARVEIAKYSLPRSRKRLARQRLEVDLPLARLLDVRKAVFGELRKYTNLGSQIGDSRPLSALRFSPDSSMLLTSSWSGNAKLWSMPGCKELKMYRAHKDRVGGVAWHPQATLTQSRDAVNFVTGGADNDVKLWSLESDSPLQTLTGHTARVVRVAFHPSGRFVGSASYDGSWRLWDVERGGEELLLQEGHSKEVYAIDFQNDGALACSGGLDAIGRVWDLRSGKSAMVLDGHVRDILAISFAPNGYQIATGSNDDTIRIWDMRSLKAIYTIPAHKSAVADLTFFRSSEGEGGGTRRLPRAFASLPTFEGYADNGDGEGEAKVDYPVSGMFLVSGGYDGCIKVWSADDWQLVKSMTSDPTGKVMSVDVSQDARFMVSAEYGRAFKLWSSPDVDLS